MEMLTVILPLAAGLVMLLIMMQVAVWGPAQKVRKGARQRLTKFAGRYGRKSTSPEDAIRSIRARGEESGLAGIVSKLLPNSAQLSIRLERAGWGMSLSRYAMMCGGLFLVSGLLVLAIGLPLILAVFIAVIIGLGIPHMIVGQRISGRVRKFTAQFPEAIDLMVRGLKSGLPVNEVLINVSQELTDPAGPEFRRVMDAVKLGTPLEAALWEMAGRIDTPDIKFFVISLSVQRETGGNLAETLTNLGTILRQRQAMKLKISALSSEAKATAWIIGLLPFIMYGLLLLLNYSYASTLFTHPTAIIASVVALIWMSIGIFIMSRMISFEV